MLSVGERCMFAGFTFIWVFDKNPCFISHGGEFIIIFDIEQNVPIWGPYMEEESDFLGTFYLKDNAFRERCGLYLDESGTLCLDMGWAPFWTKPPVNSKQSHCLSCPFELKPISPRPLCWRCPSGCTCWPHVIIARTSVAWRSHVLNIVVTTHGCHTRQT